MRRSICENTEHSRDAEILKEISNVQYIYVTVYRKTGHNAACVNIEKRSIDFLKMYCFKPTEGNG